MGEGGGRADGLHRPIERLQFEWLSGSIGASRMMPLPGDGFYSAVARCRGGDFGLFGLLSWLWF